MTVFFLVFSLHCPLFLRFVFGQTKYLTDPPCFCAGIGRGCNFANRFLPSDGSQNKENVALGKKAWSSSTYLKDDPRYGLFRDRQGCLAVNGNRHTNYVSFLDNRANANCIFTHSFDIRPKWTLDLGRNYTITDIVVYLRKDFERRFSDASITVDGQFCFTNSERYIPTELRVSCLKPLTGQIIIVSNPPTLIRTEEQGTELALNMCEFEVWVCRLGFYGKNCNMECGNCKYGCDNYYGTCLNAECRVGFHGEKCDLQCGNCSKGGECDVDGKCKYGCQPGWHGDDCKHVDLICPDGFYGSNCTLKCGRCVDIKCNFHTGNCPSGCEANYTGINCDVFHIVLEIPASMDIFQGRLGPMIGAAVAGFVFVIATIFILITKKAHQKNNQGLKSSQISGAAVPRQTTIQMAKQGGRGSIRGEMKGRRGSRRGEMKGGQAGEESGSKFGDELQLEDASAATDCSA